MKIRENTFWKILFRPLKKWVSFENKKSERDIHGPVGNNKDYLCPKITRVIDEIENGEREKRRIREKLQGNRVLLTVGEVLIQMSRCES